MGNVSGPRGNIPQQPIPGDGKPQQSQAPAGSEQKATEQAAKSDSGIAASAAETHGSEKTMKTQAKQQDTRPAITRSKDGGNAFTPPSKDMSPAKPVLNKPIMQFTPQERQSQTESFVRNMNRSQTPEQISQNLNGGIPREQVQQKKINDLEAIRDKHKGNPRKALVEIMKHVLHIGNIRGKTFSEIAKVMVNKEFEAQGMKRKAMDAQDLARGKMTDADKASQVVKWMGAVLGLVAAIVFVVIAKVLAFFTLGALSGLVVFAYQALASSVLNLMTMIVMESGMIEAIVEKQATEQAEGMTDGMTPEKKKMLIKMIVGAAVAAVQITIGVIGAVMSFGGSSGNLASAATEMTESMIDLANQFQSVMTMVNTGIGLVGEAGSAGAKIAKASAGVELAEAQSMQIDAEAAAETFDYYVEELTTLLELFQKLNDDHAKIESDIIRSDVSSIGAIAGRIGTA